MPNPIRAALLLGCASALPAAATAMDRSERPPQGWILSTSTATEIATIHGVRFEISARPCRLPGGWQAEVKVVATSADGLRHRLEDSPLRFGGQLVRCRRGACTSSGFGEGRAGGHAFPLELDGYHPQLLVRRHPSPQARLLERGDRLTLQVGIYGMERPGGGTASPALAVVRLEIPEQGPARVGVRLAIP